MIWMLRFFLFVCCSVAMVTILESKDLSYIDVPRISTRVLSGKATGAEETTIWEQWIEPHGFIPLHYHDTEEVLVILEGVVTLELSDSTIEVTSPASILVAKNELHGLHPAEGNRVHLLGIFPTANPKIWDAQGKPRPLPTEDVKTVNNPYDLET
tara:strand:- start:117 stop:581 length:465 start_codon:yes stop_codon:yes gene_type:complete